MDRDSTLRDDARQIWEAGVEAAAPERLIPRFVSAYRQALRIGPLTIKLADRSRLAIVGAGKASGAMAHALALALQPAGLARSRVTGIVAVPDDAAAEDSLPGTLTSVALLGTRPASSNFPTERGVAVANRMLKFVASLDERDVCIALISGGGSAILPAPRPPVTLDDKLRTTQFLSSVSADIRQMNCVRRQLSLVKGGGLARACRAGRLITLILSDVMGDPLDAIASGPTVAGVTTAADALDVLRRFDPDRQHVPNRVYQLLAAQGDQIPPPIRCCVDHVVIGNNQTAVDGAVECAARLGYQVESESLVGEGAAEASGERLAAHALAMLARSGARCFVSGGEPTVNLVPAQERGRGGRNQQLALAALAYQQDHAFPDERWRRTCLLAGGTDGEDGPTDAAGALVDAAVADQARSKALDARAALRRNDAYTFFQRCGGLLISGPTGTNVCDLRILVSRS